MTWKIVFTCEGCKKEADSSAPKLVGAPPLGWVKSLGLQLSQDKLSQNWVIHQTDGDRLDFCSVDCAKRYLAKSLLDMRVGRGDKVDGNVPEDETSLS